MATGQAAIAQALSVVDAAEAAHTGVEHPAEILQHAAGNLVIAAALDFAAVFALFDFYRAARQHQKAARSRRSRRRRKSRTQYHRGL